MSFDFAPKGWAISNGQLLPINQNQPLFALLGTTFGGDGQKAFALPDLRGRVPMHVGNGHTAGEKGARRRSRSRRSRCPCTATRSTRRVRTATPASPRGTSSLPRRTSTAPRDRLTPLAAGTVASVGGGQPHENAQPFLGLNFCIALHGLFPTPTLGGGDDATVRGRDPDVRRGLRPRGLDVLRRATASRSRRTRRSSR